MAFDPDSRHEFDQFEALQNSGLLDSLYESLTSKQRAMAHYKSLSPTVRGRVRALKRIQCETLKLEVQFYKELSKLEQRFADQHQKLFAQRKAIVAGDYEPTSEETSWYGNEEEHADVQNSLTKLGNEGDAPAESGASSLTKTNCRGIPGFWLTVLKHAPLICDAIQPADVPALKCLKDIRSVAIESNGQPGFQLEFEFEPNEYFSDTVLTKRYFVSYELKEEDPLTYDGPEVVASEGCKINWYPEKDLTQTTHSKTQRSRLSGEKHTVTRTTTNDSFFQFFDPPKPANSPKRTNATTEQKVLEDFDWGQYLKERVIPRAVSYFTGESLDLENEVDDPDDFPEDDYDEESEEDLDEGGDP
ncbi:hypothetical protein CRM22_004551 [Opisthorchis felineus]|uniref:Nucleosome assembly protein 1-like 1 n=2 Tax=Opisthorchis felineus TaxID=147828 RepID=A0A4S2M290_OPIFE|nr:hypothetical protein CRM22_004551 [Opisthorchis felineus]